MTDVFNFYFPSTIFIHYLYYLQISLIRVTL